MEQITYKTTGTCAKVIRFERDAENRIHNISFEGGCNGNLKGIAHLAEGMKAEDFIERCKGIKCGFKDTSCPDQLAEALKQALKSA